MNIRWEKNKWKPEDHFLKIINIWNEGWDETIGTIHPSTVNTYVKLFYDDNFKTIIHYLQPHGPWIGDTKLELKNKNNINQVGDEYLKQAYRDNLILVLKYVKELLKFFDDKKIVITSDHGELLGEGGEYLHPSQHEKIKIVPWLEKT